MKTFIFNLALALMLQVILSGGYDFEFPDLDYGLGGGYGSGYYYYPPPYQATFWIDSVKFRNNLLGAYPIRFSSYY